MIVVLGGGPAGRNAAIHLALAGREVTLVEKGGLGGIGGQCLHHGCMMVCALNEAARVLTASRTLTDLGVLDQVPRIRFPALIQQMGLVQDKIARILDAETKSAGVEIVYGREGHLEGRLVRIGDEEIEADSVIAATGSRPHIPDIPGIDLPGIFSPHTIPAMKDLPSELVIIGGGIMAAEFAYIFQAYGSTVHLVCRSAFLRNMEPGLRALARKELSMVQIHENALVSSLEGQGSEQRAFIDSGGIGEEISCNAVLVAAGLQPRSEHLLGIAKGKDGAVLVDRKMQTSVQGVYACGDVTGSPNLTPVARREGIVAAENILGRETFMDYSLIPQAMSLFHEYASVEREHPCTASAALPGPAGPGTFWLVPSGMTGYSRVEVDPKSGTLCGLHTAAPAGGVIAAYTAFLMQEGISADAWETFIEVHPMADGVYPLIKYLAATRMRKPDPDR